MRKCPTEEEMRMCYTVRIVKRLMTRVVTCTKVEVFVDKEVREAAPDREEKRVRWRNKKRVNSHLF